MYEIIIHHQQYIIMDSLVRAINPLFKLCLTLIILFTLPITYSYNAFKSVAHSIINEIIKFAIRITKGLHLCKQMSSMQNLLQQMQKKQKKPETPQQLLLSPRTRSTKIQQIQASAQRNPKSSTGNLNLLLLMQKMSSTEQSIFTESKQRCKIQKEMFEINVKMIETDSQLVKLRKDNITLLRKIQNIQDQIQDKEAEVEDSEEIVAFLEDELAACRDQLNIMEKTILV